MTNGMILAVVRLTFPISHYCDLLPSYFLCRLPTVHCRASSGRRPPFEPQPSPLSSKCPPYCFKTKGNCQLPPPFHKGKLTATTPFTSANTTYASNILRLDCFLPLYGTPLRVEWETWSTASPRDSPLLFTDAYQYRSTSKSLTVEIRPLI